MRQEPPLPANAEYVRAFLKAQRPLGGAVDPTAGRHGISEQGPLPSLFTIHTTTLHMSPASIKVKKDPHSICLYTGIHTNWYL